MVMLIYLLTDDYLKIGMITGAQGMAMMIGGFLYAPFIDNVDHVQMIKLTILPYFAAAMACIVCIYYENYEAITASQVVLGFISCIYWPTITTIVSNNVSMEERVYVNANLTTMKRLGMSFSPLVSAVFYLSFGDTWAIWLCQVVVYVGLVMSAASTLILLYLDGSETNSKDEEENQILKQNLGSSFCNSVLAILLVHNLLMMLASGMSIKYIPVFMSTYVGLSPFWVQFCEFATIMLGIVGIRCVSWMSTKLGNITAMMIPDFIGVALFFLLIWFYNTFEGTTLFTNLTFQIIASVIYCLRAGIMSSSYPMDRTITMDHCPKEHRGKLNSIESFYTATFSGSAVFGGEIIVAMSIIWNFFITASIQLSAVCLNFALYGYAYQASKVDEYKMNEKEQNMLVHDEREKDNSSTESYNDETTNYTENKSSNREPSFNSIKMKE